METAKFCPKCGHQVAEGESFCPNCGASLNGNPIQTQGIPETNNSRETSSGGNGTAGLVLGILSIVLLSWLLGVIGIALTASHRNESSRFKSGFVCSVIGTVLSVIAIILVAVISVTTGAQPL